MWGIHRSGQCFAFRKAFGEWPWLRAEDAASRYIHDKMSISTDVQECFRLAEAKRQSMGNDYLGCDHVILGVLFRGGNQFSGMVSDDQLKELIAAVEERYKSSKGGERIYIAGPMSNLPLYNFPAFDEAAMFLRHLGWDPINPAEMDRGLGFDPSIHKVTKEFLDDALRRDTDAIINHADAMVMLSGWEKSTGAKAEYHLARWKHIPVYAWPSMDEIPKDHLEKLSEKQGEISDKTEPTGTLPTVAAERKRVPIYSGVLQYFPKAIAAVAHCSWVGNEQHNPGQPLHWSREKSSDHHDCLMRHLMESGTVDTDGVRHSTKAAWRCLAALELELENA
jgi:hypothetical protein